MTRKPNVRRSGERLVRLASARGGLTKKKHAFSYPKKKHAFSYPKKKHAFPTAQEKHAFSLLPGLGFARKEKACFLLTWRQRKSMLSTREASV